MRLPIVFDTSTFGTSRTVTVYDADGLPRMYVCRGDSGEAPPIEIYRDAECTQRLFLLMPAGSQAAACEILDDSANLIGTLDPAYRNFWGGEVRRIRDADEQSDAEFRRTENWQLLMTIGLHFIPVLGMIAATFLGDRKRFAIFADDQRVGRFHSRRRLRKSHHQLSLSDELDPDLQLRLILSAIAIAFKG